MRVPAVQTWGNARLQLERVRPGLRQSRADFFVPAEPWSDSGVDGSGLHVGMSGIIRSGMTLEIKGKMN